MRTTRRKSHSDEAQSKAFIEKAREIEADGDDSGADGLMGQMARMKPEPLLKKKPPATERSEPGVSRSGTRSTN